MVHEMNGITTKNYKEILKKIPIIFLLTLITAVLENVTWTILVYYQHHLVVGLHYGPFQDYIPGLDDKIPDVQVFFMLFYAILSVVIWLLIPLLIFLTYDMKHVYHYIYISILVYIAWLIVGFVFPSFCFAYHSGGGMVALTPHHIITKILSHDLVAIPSSLIHM